MPIRETKWGNIGKTWDKGELNLEFAKKINLDKFSPPVWNGAPWGMALADKNDLNSWVKPILKVGDSVIIAGGVLGQGKIVWSGMNIFAHTVDNENLNEYSLVKQLFSYLLSSGKKLTEPELSSNYPDIINFKFKEVTSEPSWLYFREAYTIDWRPKLKLPSGKTAKVDIYKAGPGLTLIYLPALPAGSQLTLTYSLGWLLPFSIFLTLATFLFLVILVIDGLFGGLISQKLGLANISLRLKKALLPVVSQFKQKLKTDFKKEEEEY